MLVVMLQVELLVAGLLHVEFWKVMVMDGGRLLLHLLADIEMRLVGRLVMLMLVL
jgi:hypothetical protein